MRPHIGILLLAVTVAACGKSPPADTGLARDEPPEDSSGLDRRLVREITAWKKGSPPPRRLLKFPKGPPPTIGNYVSHINDDDLLKALIFDSRADAACVRAASRRLLELRGVKQVRTMLADRRRKNPVIFDRTGELATLTQLLTSSYAKVWVASLDKKDVSQDAAEKALAGLETDLAKGIPWKRAYLTAADLLFDNERSRKESGGWRTFLCYQYKGLISPARFDLLDRRFTYQLNSDHVRKLFELRRGVHRFETADVYWLYFVESFYE